MSAACDISERDLRRLLDVVSPDVTASPGLELPEELLRGIAELIPCDSVNFFVMDTRRAEFVAAQELLFVDAPEDDDDDETDAMFFQAYWDCVGCCSPELTGDHDQVSMWQDFFSERDYAEVMKGDYWRWAGFWHELLVCLPPLEGRERRLMLTRTVDDGPLQRAGPAAADAAATAPDLDP